MHNVAFSKPPIGKRGYNEDEVDAFLDLVETELARLIEENADLRQRVGELDQELASATRAGGPQTQAIPLYQPEPEPRPSRSRARPGAGADYRNRGQRAQGRPRAQPAQDTADRLTGTARAEADKMMSDAQANADQIVSEARYIAETTVNEARQRADAMLTDAQTRSEAQLRQARRRPTSCRPMPSVSTPN